MSSDPFKEGRRMSWAAAFVLIVALLLGGIAWFMYRVEQGAGRSAQFVRDAIVDLVKVQPKVTVNNRVFFEQTAPVLEVAVLSQDVQVS